MLEIGDSRDVVGEVRVTIDAFALLVAQMEAAAERMEAAVNASVRDIHCPDLEGRCATYVQCTTTGLCARTGQPCR